MERLPAEVVLEVLKCLRARDLAFSAQLVCRQWRDLLKPPIGQALWRRAFFVSWPPPLAASAAAAEEAAVAALHDRACVPAPPLPCAPEEPSEPARKPYRKAKRRGQRGTSQTQTQTQTQPEPQPQPEEQKRTKEADWKALCLLRLNTELCGTPKPTFFLFVAFVLCLLMLTLSHQHNARACATDAPKRRLAEVAEIMRAGAQAALRDQEPDDGEERGVTRQPTAVNEEDPMAEEKRRKKKKRAVPKRRGRTAKRKRSDTSEEEHPEVNPRDGMDEDIEAEEDDDTVHIPTPDFPWWEQAAEVQLAVTRAQAIIKSVSSVAYMRRNMRTVLSSMRYSCGCVLSLLFAP
jgi:hypothetical protein